VDARRMLIADSALQVIGARGMRALSHAAVDEQAGLAKGSTSYYCRKRIDLLRLTMQRLYALDRDELRAAADQLVARSPLSAADVAWVVAGVVERWLSDERRPITRARFELFLAVAHEEQLRERNQEHMIDVLTISRDVAEAIDPPSAIEHVTTTLLLADGLMINVIRQGLPSPARADIARLLAAAVGSPLPPADPEERDIAVLRSAWDDAEHDER
jgi:DNA-binding transcriptional regulator YbjK